MPDLTGLTIPEAQNVLTGAMLNPGVYLYDETILSEEDSVKARVWKQYPSPNIRAIVNLGSSVDMWLTIDTLKIQDAINPEL